MKNIMKVLVTFIITLSVALIASNSVKAASEGNFDITVMHNINGQRLDLSKKLPVDIEITKDGEVLTTIENFKFTDKLNTELPEGEYLIKVFADDLGGAEITSMEVGPVYIEEGAKVKLKAGLNKNIPVISASIR